MNRNLNLQQNGLTIRQSQAVSRAPSNARQAMAANFRLQNQSSARLFGSPVFRQGNRQNRTSTPILQSRAPFLSFGSQAVGRRLRTIAAQNPLSLSRASGTIRAPVMSGTVSRDSNQNTITIQRTQLFASNIFDQQANTPFQAVSNDVVPASMPWFNTLCLLYDEYKFLSIRVHYIGAVSTATPGRAFMYFEYSRGRKLPESLQAAQGGDQFSFFPHWTNPSPPISPTRLDPNRWYKTDPYAKQDLGGQLTYPDSVPVSLVTGFDATQRPSGLGQLGDYELHCVIQFRGARVQTGFIDQHTLARTITPPVQEIPDTDEVEENT